MKRSPLVKKGTIGHGRQIGYGDKIIHVLEGHETGPGPGAFVGDFLIWKGSSQLFRRDINGQWRAVYHKGSDYMGVMARLREEGIDLIDGDDS